MCLLDSPDCSVARCSCGRFPVFPPSMGMGHQRGGYVRGGMGGGRPPMGRGDYGKFSGYNYYANNYWYY